MKNPIPDCILTFDGVRADYSTDTVHLHERLMRGSGKECVQTLFNQAPYVKPLGYSVRPGVWYVKKRYELEPWEKDTPK